MTKQLYDFKELNFSFDLAKTNYELDVLQNKILQSYLRLDPKFRRAFNTDFTGEFFQYLKDKARLKEPISLSVRGNTRSGKSYSSITILAFLMACHGKHATAQYFCANSIEFLEKLKTMSQDELNNTCFLIDEAKNAIFGEGSVAKKLKIRDVQNIIAINNISTIMLTPDAWSGGDGSHYGLRSFGRCFKTKTNRFMLYNLQEGTLNSKPLGMVYIPIFTEFIPKPYSEQLEKDYLDRKMKWVEMEQRGEGDVLAELRKNIAMNFLKDEKFLTIKKQDEKRTYISIKLGSEYTKSEVDQILSITKLYQMGVLEEE